jgi:hypothetical protein
MENVEGVQMEKGAYDAAMQLLRSIYCYIRNQMVGAAEDVL